MCKRHVEIADLKTQVRSVGRLVISFNTPRIYKWEIIECFFHLSPAFHGLEAVCHAFYNFKKLVASIN